MQQSDEVVVSWRSLLNEARHMLGEQFDARVIVEEVAQERLGQLVVHLDNEPSARQRQMFNELVERRCAGEPLQHIIGHWSFRTIELTVDRRALVPRPETEVVVELALRELSDITSFDGPCRVVDLGTGSGAIALAIATENEHAVVVGIDSSDEAICLAIENRDRCPKEVARRVEFLIGDFKSAATSGQFADVPCVVSNPPYLSTAEWFDLDRTVRDFDPYGALVAGPTGYEAINAVIDYAALRLSRPGALVMEIAPHQGHYARERALVQGALSADIHRDLAGRDRVLDARW